MSAATTDRHRALVRFFALAPLPPVLGLGLLWLFWGFLYLTFPVFFPFVAFTESCSPFGTRGPTIFHETGWYWSAAYMVLIVATTTAFTFHRSYRESVAALLTIFLVFNVVTQSILYFAGFCLIEGP